MVSFRTHVPLLLYLTGIFFLTFLARIFPTPLLPAIEGDLNIGHGTAGSLFLNISLGFFAGVLGSGFVSSRLTHRWTIILSSVAVGVSLFAVSLSQTLWWIRLGLTMVGLSTGLYLPSGIATLTDRVNPKDWGKAIAVHELAPILSYITAPLLAEGLMIWFSWRGVVSVVGGAAVVTGGIFICLGRGGAFFGETPNPTNLRTLLIIPSFWIMVVFFGVGIGASLGVYTMLPLYLVAEEGLQRGLVNTIVAISRIAGLGVIFVAGWVTDGLGPRRTLGGTFLTTGMATILLGMLHEGWIIPALFLQPALACCFFPAGFAALSKIGPPQIRNVAVSLAMPMAYLVAAGAIPTGIGILGEHGFFSLGFMLVGILLIGIIPLLNYLKFHDDAIEETS